MKADGFGGVLGCLLFSKFSFEANRIKRAKNYVLQQFGYPAVQLYNANIIEQKLNYIRENPVKEVVGVLGIVFRAEDYVYSSACNYCSKTGLVNTDLLN